MKLLDEGRFVDDNLTIEETPNKIQRDRKLYNVHKSAIKYGFLTEEEESPERRKWWLPLATRLECLSEDVSHALLVVSPECFAVTAQVDTDSLILTREVLQVCLSQVELQSC